MSSASIPLLDRVPDEVLLEIVSHFDLDPNGDPHHQVKQILEAKASLLNLALSSKRMNGLVTPLVYRAFVHTGKRSLPGLLKQLLDKPELGKHVKRIFCCTYNFRSPKALMDVKCFSEDDYTWFTGIAQGHGLALDDRAMDLADDVAEGHWDPMFALLLCRLPALEHLTFYDHGVTEMMRVHQALYQLSSEGGLSHLTSISLHYRGMEHGFALPQIMPFLCQKALQKFYINRLQLERSFRDELGAFGMPDFDDFDDDFDEFAPPGAMDLRKQAFSVKDLHLDHCNIDGDKLVEFLAAFPDLQRLKYSHGGPLAEFATFRAKKIGEAISHLKPCLESLEVAKFYIPGEEFIDENEEDDRSRIGSLVEFERLREISLDLSILLGVNGEDWEYNDENEDENEDEEEEEVLLVNLLPKSVEKLKITNNWTFNVICHLPHLIKQKEELTPTLDLLQLQGGRWDILECARQEREDRLEDDDDDWCQTVEKDFRDVGVTLEFVN